MHIKKNKNGLINMNWEKCMKKMNCKVCSDYKYCKDDIKEKKKDKKKNRRNSNASKSIKRLSRQNNK